ncbi:MAG: lytic transglycosylase domain-containing protein [Cardiobacteriaceae bacterium]|nr:lytic transglycosylase domain-containing protein [Cardiobacteriaceae bacterium]
MSIKSKALWLAFVVVGMAEAKEHCGSYVKNGKTVYISCALDQKFRKSQSQSGGGMCRATLTMNGKTKTYERPCPVKQPVPQKLTQDFSERQKALSTLIDELSKQHGLESALVHAVVSVESAYYTHIISPKGAMGLMQLMPETAKALGVENGFDPKQNVDGGIRYLKQQLIDFQSLELALAAYNAGPGNVRKYGNQIPPFKETQAYVAKVLEYRKKYQNEWAASIKPLPTP